MKKSIAMLIVSLLVFSLAGCGEKSQEDVIAALDKKLEEMTGYKGNATMTLETGNEPQVYDIEVWHKKKDYYRVHLKNANKEQSQMILRNDEGVFVLTPALNKSFKFQSEWPDNSSQAYLYESLVSDILNDEEVTFKATEDHYVFVTKTNYQNNKTLPKQEITLDKGDLSPVMVKVMDTDMNTLVQVDFSDFEFNPEFDEGAFDLKKNMTSAQIGKPTMAQADKRELMVLYPLYQPEGVQLIEEKEVQTENGKRIVLTFAGENKSFTLYEELATVMPASNPIPVDGEPVDLGFTVGAITNNSVMWSHEGVDYYLASKDLSKEELVKVARSVQGQAVK